MNAAWKKVLPECVMNESTATNLAEIQTAISNLANQKGFSEVNNANVSELMESHHAEISAEELIQLLDSSIDAEGDVSEVRETIERIASYDCTLTFKKLSHGLKYLDKVKEIFELDSNKG